MAATPTASKLLERARNGERLTTKERRHVIAWLQATGGDNSSGSSMTYTNQQLADIFGITERAIRQDKQAFRKEKAAFIREEDVSLIIADIALDYERQIRDIERSKEKAELGTQTYLAHCTNALNLRVQMVKALQDLGYYPKNLGQLTVTKWDFQAQVDSTTGYVVTEQVPAGEEFPILDAEVVKPKALGKGNIDEETTRNGNFEFVTEEYSDDSGSLETSESTPETV